MSLSKIIQNFIEQHKIDEEFFVEQNFKYLSQEDESDINLLSIIQSFRYILIQGAPGVGKTANLIHLGYHFAQEYLKSPKKPFPVYLKISDLKENESIFYITSYNYEISAESLAEFFSQGQCILLFDELDGIPRERVRQIISEITKLMELYPEVMVVVTCRTIYGELSDSLPTKFQIVTPLPLNDLQIEKYLKNSMPFEKQNLLNQMRTIPWLISLSRYPFFLKLITEKLVEFSFSSLTSNPQKIINKFVDMQLNNETYLQGFSEDNVSIILENVAAKMYSSSVFQISFDELERIILLNEMPSQIIYQILNTNLIIQISHYEISFSHLTYYELFINRYINRILSRKNKITTYDLDWRQELSFSIRLSSDINRIDLKETILTIDNSIKKSGLQSNKKFEVVPLYAKIGSIELAIAVLFVAPIGYAFKEFSKEFGSYLGREMANRIISQKTTLPVEIEQRLPFDIKDNPELTNHFMNEYVSKIAHNLADEKREQERVKDLILVNLKKEFGRNIEESQIEKILGD